MEIGAGECRAVSGDQKVCPLEIRRSRWDKVELHGPVAQLCDRGSTGRTISRGAAWCSVQAPGHAPWAAAREGGAAGLFPGVACQLGLTMRNRLFAERRGFALLYRDGVLRAFTEAIAETVAVLIADQPRLAVGDLYCALVTCLGTETAR